MRLSVMALGWIAVLGCSSDDAMRADAHLTIDASASDATHADAHSIDAAPMDASDESVIPADASETCTSHTQCEERLGIPALAGSTPCGGCWSVCGRHPVYGGTDGECGEVCFEAAACFFEAGCGPNCESLCDTTEDCVSDETVCIDGLCARSET